MATVARALTCEDLCRAREDGKRYELIEGELFFLPTPTPKHQRFLGHLTIRLHKEIVEPGLGWVLTAPLDVRLGRSYVQPDLMAVLTDRAGIMGEAMLEGAPDLLAEIGSPASRTMDLTTKLALYAQSGVREYWFVDPSSRLVTVHAEPAREGFRRIERMEDAAESTIIPGLTVDVRALFAEPTHLS
jgi:Uma2 family endonuclease